MPPVEIPMSRCFLWSALVCLAAAGAPGVHAHTAAAQQSTVAAPTNALYSVIRGMALTGGRAEVAGLVLKRDRVTMTFTGTFYFAAPAGSRVLGAVFIGQGTMQAQTPPGAFEREQLKRLIGSDVAESDFRTAVLRWSDDTFEVIGAARQAGGDIPAQATRLASAFEGRATFDLTFRHRTFDNIAAIGATTPAVPDPADPQVDAPRTSSPWRTSTFLAHQRLESLA